MSNGILGLLDVISSTPSPLLEKEQKQIKSVNEGSPLNPDYKYLWDSCSLDENSKTQLNIVCNKINQNKSRYQAIENTNGVTWYLIAAIHYRETSLSFKAAFHNGDQIIGTGEKTTHVPAGRGPFDQWEDSVVDACKLLKLDQIKNWDVYTSLAVAERYNGLGYRKKENENGEIEYSPYVWAGTNNSDETGKFAADGKYDPLAEEKQLGVAAIFLGLGI